MDVSITDGSWNEGRSIQSMGRKNGRKKEIETVASPEILIGGGGLRGLGVGMEGLLPEAIAAKYGGGV